MISQKSVQEVLDTARIEEVIGDFINLKRRGSNRIGLCPFHLEKTPSFMVSPAKNIYKCFGCGKSGTPATFMMEHEKYSFPEAIRYLAKKYNLPIEEIELTPQAKEAFDETESIYVTLQFAKEYFEKQLFETDMGKSVALPYFRERGFTEQTMHHFGLGYTASHKDEFTKYAILQQFSLEALQKAGLTTQYSSDFFKERVMFAFHNLSGKIIGFAGRIMDSNAKSPKYINSPETEVYIKNKFLYGLYQAKQSIRRHDECLLVEGYTDVISLAQEGFDNVVASSGTSLTDGQILLIKRFTSNIKILYDGDPAGIKAAFRAMDLLLEKDMNIRVVLFPDKEDPDSYLRKNGKEAFRELIENHSEDFILFKSNLLLKGVENDPVKKSQLLKEIVTSLSFVTDRIKLDFYIKECAKVFNIQEVILYDEVRKVVREKGSDKKQKFGPAPPDIDPNVPFSLDQMEFPKKELPKSNDYLLEFHFAKLMVRYCDKKMQNGSKVAEYLLQTFDEIPLENAIFSSIFEYARTKVANNEPITSYDFVQHSDSEISRTAADFLIEEFEMSKNWPSPLQNQKEPEQNYEAEILSNIDYLVKNKTEKIKAQISNDIKNLNHAQTPDEIESVKVYMKAFMMVMASLNTLNQKSKTVVYKL